MKKAYQNTNSSSKHNQTTNNQLFKTKTVIIYLEKTM